MDVGFSVLDLAGTGHLEGLFVLGQDVARGVAFRHVADTATVNSADQQDYRSILNATSREFCGDSFDDFLAWLNRDHKHLDRFPGKTALSDFEWVGVRQSACYASEVFAARLAAQGFLQCAGDDRGNALANAAYQYEAAPSRCTIL